MTAESTVEETITNAISIANDTTALATSFSEQAQTTAGGSLSIDLPDPEEPDTPVPDSLYLPTEDLTGIFESTFDANTQMVKDALGDDLPDYMTAYFPDYGDVMSAVTTWLEDVIENSTTGITASYENAVWERDRQRTLKELQRVKEGAYAELGARGYSLPNAMLLSRVDAADMAALEQGSARSREIAINHLEFALKQVQFAIQQAVALRQNILDSIVSYIQAYLNALATGTNRAASLVRAKTELYTIAHNYYRTYYQWGDLALKYQGLLSDVNINESKIFADATVQNRDSRVKAAIGGAEAMGRVAAAAMSSQNTLATIAHETTATE